MKLVFLTLEKKINGLSKQGIKIDTKGLEKIKIPEIDLSLWILYITSANSLEQSHTCNHGFCLYSSGI